MTERPCVCGCGRPAAPGSKYADRERCRHTVYRRKIAQAQVDAGIPQRLNLATLTPSSPTRVSDAPRVARKVTARKPDLRISYRKAVQAIGSLIGDTESAERHLRPLLTEAARKALENS